MAAVGVVAVGGDGIVEALEVDVLVVEALGEAVGHEQVEHVAGVESAVVLGRAVAGLELIVERALAAVEGVANLHLAGFGLRRDGEIEELVVFRIEGDLAVELDAGVVEFEAGVGDAGGIDGELECVVGHTDPPERGFDRDGFLLGGVRAENRGDSGGEREG